MHHSWTTIMLFFSSIIESHIQFNQTKADIQKDNVESSIVNCLNSVVVGSHLPIPLAFIVAANKNDLMVKAIADLEASLISKLKYIASVETNSLRLLTNLKADTEKDNVSSFIINPQDSIVDGSHLSISLVSIVANSSIAHSQDSVVDGSHLSIPSASIVSASSIENPQDYVVDGSHLPIPSVSIVPSNRNDLVEKAIADLEASLISKFEDIASSETNNLRLLTVLKFSSLISLGDGALPVGVKVIIESLHQEFLDIMCTFKLVIVIINKVPKFINEAQEKEAWLNKEISRRDKYVKDCDVELLYVLEQKNVLLV